jgi:hypothetical protein
MDPSSMKFHEVKKKKEKNDRIADYFLKCKRWHVH